MYMCEIASGSNLKKGGGHMNSGQRILAVVADSLRLKNKGCCGVCLGCVQAVVWLPLQSENQTPAKMIPPYLQEADLSVLELNPINLLPLGEP